MFRYRKGKKMNTRHQKHTHGLDSKATRNRLNHCKAIFTRALVFVLLMVLLAPTPVQAVSADDGFDPGANDSVNTIALQADGKIVTAGFDKIDVRVPWWGEANSICLRLSPVWCKATN